MGPWFISLLVRWWDVGECEEVGGRGPKANDQPELNMFNVAGVFLLLATGAVLGLIVCAVEYLSSKVASNIKARSFM